MEPSTANTVAVVAGSIAIAIVLFVVLRRFVLWYFKLDKIAESLQMIESYFRRESAESRERKMPWACPKCKAMNPNDTYTCKSCGYSLT